MAAPNFYQTVNNVGVDVTQYLVASASVTPEYPAPPFLPGTRAFGSDGSEFLYVQASTTINPSDFVMLNSGEEDRAVTQVSVVMNWFDELKRLVPAK